MDNFYGHNVEPYGKLMQTGFGEHNSESAGFMGYPQMINIKSYYHGFVKSTSKCLRLIVLTEYFIMFL